MTIISKVKKIWKQYNFEICFGCIVLFILIYAIMRRGKKGTWSNSYFFPEKFKKEFIFPKKESKGEIQCKKVLEEIFNKPFHKQRPNFLRNPITSTHTNENNLELDCYNEELKLAVEYNGIQHYKYTPYFHKTKESFHNQKYRDYIKREQCKKNGIFLIEVPYTVKVEDIKTFILDKLSLYK